MRDLPVLIPLVPDHVLQEQDRVVIVKVNEDETDIVDMGE
jgi:hypothetical protein